ncbi:uncharacterized protein BJ171DRAFT_11440 [Polychytrium aggregatum]|uniref:uncharacterized protein n=1 Tax=Polychytrium aggregatum TaxID=110093 RepID=UPI0022FEE085|nr:uncharacterized protein BJ171DRAFT_11440 [Polychytrium aggregatum]KAI9206547.1 hypothetical protein BJ171DRAFT_11440 [Polychytrium aggregatum]
MSEEAAFSAGEGFKTPGSALGLPHTTAVVHCPSLTTQPIHGSIKMQAPPTPQTRPPWWIDPDRVVDISPEPFAVGGFGEIHTADYNGFKVAVKKIHGVTTTEKVTTLRKEIDLWWNCRDLGILTLVGAYIQDGGGVMVSEFMKNGSLDKYLRQHQTSIEEKLRWMFQVACEMQYLHSKDMVHGDLKPSNVLLNSDFNAVMSDFSTARYKRETTPTEATKTIGAPLSGTYAFIAPEISKDNFQGGYTKSSDVFAYGVMLYVVLKNCGPLWLASDNRPMSAHRMLTLIEDNKRPDRFEGIPHDIWALIEHCWHQEPQHRPTFVQIVPRLEHYRRLTNIPTKPTPPPVSIPATMKRPLEVSTQTNDEHRPTKIVCIDLDADDDTQNPTVPTPAPAPTISDDNPPEYTENEASVAPVVVEQPDITNIPEAFKRAWDLLVLEEYRDAVTNWQTVYDSSSDPVMKPIATLMMGWCYYHGFGVAMDIPRGYNLMLESITDDFNLGVGLIDLSIRVESMTEAAKEFFRLCDTTSSLNWVCKHLATICRFHRFGARLNQTKIFEDFQDLAEKGHAISQQIFGDFYQYDQGFKKNLKKAVEWYTKAANQGYTWGQYNLGVCYDDGKGVTQDYTKAVEWYTKSAEQGNADAQNNLGDCYYDGNGVAQDYTKAVEWFTKSAEQGNAYAQNNLGNCYYNGDGVAQDYTKAVEWYTKAAEQGNADAQNNLGNCYYNGDGVAQDYTKAVEWYTKSAEQGNAYAQNDLGDCYYDGNGVAQDYTKAVEWFTKAANQGNAAAQNSLGVHYAVGKGVKKDLKKAVEWYTKAAEQGNADAQNDLGDCYYDGNGVAQDYTKAVEWFTKAANQGNAAAQNSLGDCYYGGQGVDQDYAKAVEWFTKAANQGNAWGQNNIGNCYRNGKGVAQDYVKAIEWYTKAANQGNVWGQNNIGNCYRDGKGVSKDIETARSWYQKAADQGHERAKTALERLAKSK